MSEGLERKGRFFFELLGVTPINFAEFKIKQKAFPFNLSFHSPCLLKLQSKSYEMGLTWEWTIVGQRVRAHAWPIDKEAVE